MKLRLCRLDNKGCWVEQGTAARAAVVGLVQDFPYRSQDVNLAYDGVAPIAYNVYKHCAMIAAIE
jgi:hypothetical protein